MSWLWFGRARQIEEAGDHDDDNDDDDDDEEYDSDEYSDEVEEEDDEEEEEEHHDNDEVEEVEEDEEIAEGAGNVEEEGEEDLVGREVTVHSDDPAIAEKSNGIEAKFTVEASDLLDHASTDAVYAVARTRNKKSSEHDEGAVVVDDEVQQEIWAGAIPDSVRIGTQSDAGVDGEITTPTGNRPRAPSGLTMGDSDDEVVEDDQEDEVHVRQPATSHEDGPGSANMNEMNTDDDNTEEEEEDDEDEGETTTTLAEKQSLLMLAVEHDRVDILQSILAENTHASSDHKQKNDEGETEHQHHCPSLSAERDALLHGHIPPLHLACAYGSVSATNFLLRAGADPSVRPDMARIKQEMESQPPESRPPVELSKWSRFDGITAWEVVFGRSSSSDDGNNNNHNNNHHDSKNQQQSWSLFGGKRDLANRRPLVELPSHKLAAIKNAFTAEALRCFGDDDVNRLEQLLRAGVPPTSRLGEQSLYDWAVELGALQCEERLRPAPPSVHVAGDDNEQAAPSTKTQTSVDASDGRKAVPSDANKHASGVEDDVPKRKSVVLELNATNEESISHLTSRLHESEALARALSNFLDHLAEEVSVCSGLLLAGGGAAALASHVRSLRAKKERKEEEYAQAREIYESRVDELANSIREYRARVQPSPITNANGKSLEDGLFKKVGKTIVLVTNEENGGLSADVSGNAKIDGEAEGEDEQREMLLNKIADTDKKIVQLRASIADLSDENERNLAEVERRGLTGGIDLVRKMRDEIKELEFQCSEWKNLNDECLAKIVLLQRKLEEHQEQVPVRMQMERPQKEEGELAHDLVSEEDVEQPVMEEPELETVEIVTATDSTTRGKKEAAAPIPGTINRVGGDQPEESEQSFAMEKRAESSDNKGSSTEEQSSRELLGSEVIASGRSTALAVKDGNHFSTSLWRILMRIIGLGSSSPARPPPPPRMQEDPASKFIMII